jgi:hypothetical protein
VVSGRSGHTAVAIVGRPVPPASDDGFTLEITRTSSNGTLAAEVAIYRAMWTLIRLRGYEQLITHTEMGAIRRGLAPIAAVPPRAGTHVPPRLRVGRGVDGATRVRWQTVPGHTARPAPGYASTADAIPIAGPHSGPSTTTPIRTRAA